MHLWKKNTWCLGLIAVLILILSIINLNLVCSKNFEPDDLDIDYPKEVYLNEEFEVHFYFDKIDISVKDVKIDIINSEGKRISRIYDKNENKYKSTNYYLKEVDNQDTFKLIISQDYFGDAELFVTINSESNKKTKFGPYQISIKKLKNNKEERETEEVIENRDTENNVIDLRTATTKSIKSNFDNEVLFKSQNQKIKEKAIYFFIFFCFVIGIYFVIKEYKNDKRKSGKFSKSFLC